MERKNFDYVQQGVVKLHEEVVNEIISLMNSHDTDEVDLLGSNCQHAQVIGLSPIGINEDDPVIFEVSVVYVEDGKLMLDVIIDVDTEELAETNEDGDIGDEYQVFDATDYSHIVPCSGIVSVYNAVYEVLEEGA